MALLDTTALSAVLKTKYTQKNFRFLTYQNNPFYAMVPKRTDFGGKNKVVAMRYGAPQGRGISVAVAQGGKTASAYTAFTVTRTSDYATASITGEAIRAAKGDANTLVEGLTKEIDATIYTSMRSLALFLAGDGGGSRGQISSGSNVGTPTITLAVPSDIVNFEVGMKVSASADNGVTGSAGLRSAGAVATITGIDRDLGTLTISGNWSASIAAVAAGDYLFQNSLAGASNSDYQAVIKGAFAWCPIAAPSATAFFGVDRTADKTRLGGVRISGNGGPIEETLVEAAARLVREGSTPSHCFMNPLDYSQLVRSLGAKVTYDRAKSFDEPEIGFKAVQLDGPKGPINVVADLNFKQGYSLMGQLDTWCLESLGECPGILAEDDLMIFRSATSDDYEVRVGYYGNVTNEAPGWNAAITL